MKLKPFLRWWSIDSVIYLIGMLRLQMRAVFRLQILILSYLRKNVHPPVSNKRGCVLQVLFHFLCPAV